MLENLKHLTKCTNEVPLKEKKKEPMKWLLLYWLAYFTFQGVSLSHFFTLIPALQSRLSRQAVRMER